ncbi:MAG: GGDEF domain-containing protein [Myxococcales bacterium]|nr:GGDEF domain-containing protein [Myxococcales bacterium]
MSRKRARTSETTKLDLANPEELARPLGKGPLGSLVVLQGPESDIGTHRFVDTPVILGRDPECELPLDDLRISRRHCRVGSDGKGYYVEDLRSTNGTKVNGDDVEKKAPLKPGDCIYLGSCVVKFTVATDPEVAYHEQMDARIGTDDLTGLVVKRRFDAAYARALASARVKRESLSVLMLDMDGLKTINDTHGHPFGAYAIAEVGKIIGEVVTPHGAACRLGGDEFAAFLRAQSKGGAIAFAELICRWIREHRYERDGVILKPTISIGVACYPDDGRTPELLLRRADDALYRAKKAGRDRVSD